jgi:hypothetical protein
MSASHNRDSEAAHDILAAEAFSVPAADPDLHHGPVVLPEDPTGIAEAHDILAAEEFAMPAPPHHPEMGLARRSAARRGTVQAGAAVVLGLLLLRLLRRRARSG